MAVTFIAHTEVGSGGAANITFSSIPSTYDDLWLVVSGRTSVSSNAQPVAVQMNTDTATTNYSRTVLHHSNGSLVTSGYTGGTFAYIAHNSAPGALNTANTFSSVSSYIPNYKNTSNYKQIIGDSTAENNSTTAYSHSLIGGLWGSTSAINQLVIFLGSGNFVQYSTATLYGITKA